MHGALSDEHHLIISSFIENRVGIRFRAEQAQHAGRPPAQAPGRRRTSPYIEDYCNLLSEDGALGDELTHPIDCMTTNKTDFFRGASAHFNLLRDNLSSRSRGPGQEGAAGASKSAAPPP